MSKPTSEDTFKFKGFVWPEENWHPIPNQWSDITHDVKSLAELKVIEYVLRHTWGYRGQRDKPKRISLNEFSKGRKKAGGGRLDKGIGMSKSSVRHGIALAVQHKFLEVTEDRRDMGRIKRYYKLKMTGESTGEETIPQGTESIPSPQSRDTKVIPLNPEVIPRTRKDNFRKTTPKRRGGRRTSLPPPTGLFSSDFDMKAAGYLREVLALHDSDLTSPPKVVKVQTLAKSIFRLRTERESATEAEIKAVIKWLKVAYGSVHVPKMRKADDLFTNWGRYREAKRGWEEDRAREDGHYGAAVCEDDGPAAPPGLVNRVRDWMEKHLGIVDQPADQSEVDQALEALGHPAGTVSDREF